MDGNDTASPHFLRFVVTAMLLCAGLFLLLRPSHAALQNPLFPFTAPQGSYPFGDLSIGPDGKTVYGAAWGGGASDAGVIFTLPPGSTTPQVVYSFDGRLGAHPGGGLTTAADGNLYGVTTSGGASGFGTIYQLTPGSVPVDLYDFPANQGPSSVFAELVVGPDGNLYGVQNSLSTAGQLLANEIFRVVLGAGAPQVQPNWLKLSTVKGIVPMAMVAGPPNTLFLACNRGGAQGFGALSQISALNGQPKQTALYSFGAPTDSSNTLGSFPSNLVYSTDVMTGNPALFGTTAQGPNSVPSGSTTGQGSFFEALPAVGTPTVLYPFTPNDQMPSEVMRQASDGSFYYVTYTNQLVYQGFAAGYVWRIARSSGSPTLLSALGPNDGAAQSAFLETSPAPNQTFLLTSGRGGEFGFGEVLLVPQIDNYIPIDLFGFNYPDGGDPIGGVIVDKTNTHLLLGTTRRGGAHGFGCVVQLDWTQPQLPPVHLHDFTGYDGFWPTGTLVQGSDSDGILYGTTDLGGEYFVLGGQDIESTGFGTVWSLDPIMKDPTGQYQFTILHSFHGDQFLVNQPQTNDGSGPFGGLAFDSTRSFLYGTTQFDGPKGYGTVFKVSSDGTSFKTIAQFDPANVGFAPFSSLLLSKNGKSFYGTCGYGAKNFNAGANPQSTPTGWGSVFQVTTSASPSFASLHAFDDTTVNEGSHPKASLVLGSSDGLLYGTTSGGADGSAAIPTVNGTTFNLVTTASGTFNVLAQLTGQPDALGITAGSQPSGALTPFGTVNGLSTFLAPCFTGGRFGKGCVFALSVSSDSQSGSVSTLVPFGGTNPNGTPIASDIGDFPTSTLALDPTTKEYYGTTTGTAIGPAPGQPDGSAYGVGTIYQVVPTSVSGLSKHSVPANYTLPIVVNGDGFSTDQLGKEMVLVNGAAVATTYVSRNQLTFLLPTIAGPYPVNVPVQVQDVDGTTTKAVTLTVTKPS